MSKHEQAARVLFEVYGCKDADDFNRSFDICTSMAKEAMVRYAEIKAIEFAEKLDEQGYTQFHQKGRWKKVNGGSIDLKSTITTEQLYKSIVCP